MVGKGADSGGGNAESLIAAARQQVEKKDLPGAIATLQQALALADCSPEARLDAATVFADAGDKEKGVAACLDAGTHYLYDMGDMPKARAAFAQAHQIDAGNLDVIFQMGQADVVEGRTQDALAKFIDVLRKSNLKHVPALFEAGCIYQANGQYDQAILAFKKVLDRDKAHVQAIVHMGQLHQTKGMVPESLGYYLQAAEIARESKQFGTAQQLCNMVLALDGSNQKARFMLDDLAERSQEIEDAAAAQAQAAAAPTPADAPASAGAAPVPPQTANGAPSAPAAVSPDVAKSVDEAKRALAELADQRSALQKEMDDLAAARVDAEAALASAKDEAEAALAQRTAALATRSAAEIELAALTESLTRTRSQADEAARRKAELDAELVAATAALNGAKKADSEISASAEKRRAEIETELAALAAKKAEAQAAAAASSQALTAAQTQLKKAQTDLQKTRDELAAAGASKASEETAAAQAAVKLQELQAQIDALSGRQAATAAEAKSAASARETLAAEIAAMEKRVAELAQAKTDGEAASARARESLAQAQAAVDVLAGK